MKPEDYFSPERLKELEAEGAKFLKSPEGVKLVEKIRNLEIDPSIPLKPNGEIDRKKIAEDACEYITVLDFWDMTPREVLFQIECGNRHDEKVAALNASLSRMPVEPEEKYTDLDNALLDWVRRDSSVPNMEEYLSDWAKNGGGTYSKSAFQRALRKAAKDGRLIEKDDDSNRFREKR